MKTETNSVREGQRGSDARITISRYDKDKWMEGAGAGFRSGRTLIDSKLDLANSVNATLREMKRKALPTDLVASYVGSGRQC